MVKLLSTPQGLSLEMTPASNREIETLASEMLKLPQASYRLKTYFAPGVYVREIWMPRGALIVGAEHLTEHFNIVASGQALVVMGERIERMVAPYCVVSKRSVRKVLLILEDCVWYTIHANPDNETDEAVIESRHISPRDVLHRQDIADAERQLKGLADILPDFSKPSPLKP